MYTNSKNKTPAERLCEEQADDHRMERRCRILNRAMPVCIALAWLGMGYKLYRYYNATPEREAQKNMEKVLKENAAKQKMTLIGKENLPHDRYVEGVLYFDTDGNTDTVEKVVRVKHEHKYQLNSKAFIESMHQQYKLKIGQKYSLKDLQKRKLDLLSYTSER